MTFFSMLFQLKLRSQVGASRPLPIKKRRPDLKTTLKKLANEPLGARFRALFANWDALLGTGWGTAVPFVLFLGHRGQLSLSYYFLLLIWVAGDTCPFRTILGHRGDSCPFRTIFWAQGDKDLFFYFTGIL